jgi:hypothetical protein
MNRFRKFILSLMAPKICQVGDVVLTRNGRAYWVRPGALTEMKVIRFNQIKDWERNNGN